MAKLSPVPANGIDEPSKPEVRGKAANPAQSSSNVSLVSAAGPRKLIRPSLPARAAIGRLRAGRAHFLAIPALEDRPESFTLPSSHAETFYLQKQVQQRTFMVIVLEDGEQIEGYIEWYDSKTIKVRNNGRMLIYKSSIKYMYKAGENFRA
jgi:sRNA-binding regulator protein Hfq